MYVTGWGCGLKPDCNVINVLLEGLIFQESNALMWIGWVRVLNAITG